MSDLAARAPRLQARMENHPVSIPSTLERIAVALESIATALTGQPPAATTPAPHRPDPQHTRFEWEPDTPDTPNVQPLPEPAPPQERCGFLIEQYTHPLDRSTPIYQVSKDGVSVVLTGQEADVLELGDDEFTAAMAGHLAQVLAARVRETPAQDLAAVMEPAANDEEDEDYRREREWAASLTPQDES